MTKCRLHIVYTLLVCLSCAGSQAHTSQVGLKTQDGSKRQKTQNTQKAENPPKAQIRPKSQSQPTSGPSTKEELQELLEKQKRRIEGEYPEGESGDYQRIADTFGKIPEDITRTKLSREELTRLALESQMLSKQYLEKYPEGEHRAAVLFFMAKGMILNQQGAIAQLAQETGLPPLEAKRLYLKEAMKCLDQASTLAVAKTDLSYDITESRGTIYFFSGDYDKAAEVYAKLMQEKPSAKSLMSLIGAHERARRFEAALEHSRTLPTKYPHSQYTPHALFLTGKMLIFLGRLEEATRHFSELRPIFEKAAQGSKVEALAGTQFGGKTAQDFFNYLERLDFWVGYCNFALGNYEEARVAFEKGLNELNRRQTAGSLTNVGQVFQGRCHRHLAWIDQLVGKPAPAVNIDEGWVMDRFDVSAQKGKVTALLFFPMRNPRGKEYLQVVQDFYRRAYDRGFRAAFLALPRGRKDHEKQKQDLLAEYRELGLTMPTGLAITPDNDWPPTPYKDYGIAAGTPTIVVLNHRGEVAWARQDPTFRDFATSNRVVERLLGEIPE